MKGVVLAGGSGSRLRPLTAVTNKHLLPVYNQPMIYYPIQTLVNAGITDIMIVTGGNSAGDFLKLLGNGKTFGLKHLNYTYQDGAGGIAQAPDRDSGALRSKLESAAADDPTKKNRAEPFPAAPAESRNAADALTASLPQLAQMMAECCMEEVEDEPPPPDDALVLEAEIPGLEEMALAGGERPGRPAAMTCPDCNGAMFEIDDASSKINGPDRLFP